MKQGLDTPALGIDLQHRLCRQIRLGRQNQARTRPGVVGLAHLAPHRSHRESFQKSRHGDHRAHPYPLRLAIQHQFHSLHRQRIEHCRIDALTVLAFASPALGLRFGPKIQRRIPAHLADDVYLLFEQGQDQTAAHEPGIDQQARLLEMCPDRVEQLSRYPEFAALARFFDQPGANRYCQRRTQSDSHDQGQRDPALAVQKAWPIGLVAVVVLDTDTRSCLRATRNQRIVDDQIHRFAREHSLHQLQQTNRQVRDRYMRSLDQLVVGGPVCLPANGSDSACDPALRIEHATDQQFHEGTAGTRRNSHKEKGNPFREQQTDRSSERHEGASEIENDPSLVAALLALKPTPSEQRGDLADRTSCQVFFAFS